METAGKLTPVARVCRWHGSEAVGGRQTGSDFTFTGRWQRWAPHPRSQGCGWTRPQCALWWVLDKVIKSCLAKCLAVAADMVWGWGLGKGSKAQPLQGIRGWKGR